ncbi:hypothetical protein DB88DRAFT_491937 [Papiliotrema laurentii]|uniref:UspA domain-containing protein n=1 Tax=Papiliotrema laurentii TaxID=5418 RepID=A0AAD9CX18_PAPLA|nr:hypothetical protein DB88DRAFT_491937 [Papiliotrema laurentii]
MSLRPLLRKSQSTPTSSTHDLTENQSPPQDTNTGGPIPTTTTQSANPISPSGSSTNLPTQPTTSASHISFDSTVTTDRPGMEHKPHSALVVGGAAGHGMPRTRTNSSGQGTDGRYRRKVGFEAFEAGPDALFAYTCQAKSEGYKRSRNTRVFAVAVSADESGEDALDWLMSELVEDGDEIVAIRVIELGEGERHDPDAQEEFREDAHTLLTNILDKNNEADDRRISVIVEFVAGRVQDMLLKMIALYRPDSLIVGTKGTRSKLQTWGKVLGAPGMGSVSRFAVSHSPVPVIVVRPERKVKKTLEKRQNNPKRGQYAALVGQEGLSLSRSRSRGSINGLSDKE